MRNRFALPVLGLLVVAAVLTFALDGSPVPAADSVITIQPLASPAGANRAEPQMTVQGDRVILSWLETAGNKATLKYSERTASGWSQPQAVAAGDNFFVNSFDVPSVRALPDGTLAAHWMLMGTKDPESDATNISLSWSKDQGKTWSKPVSPHHDGTKTGHGFVTLFQAPGAGLGLVWLDGRLTNPEKETGNTSLRTTAFDRDGKQLKETVIDPRVCECCSTAVAETSEGLIVAYRDRSPSEVRDIAVARLVAGKWSAPALVHNDGWKIDACPINGPAISARGRDVVVAWFTAKGGDQETPGRAFIAFSRDAGHTFGGPVRVDDAGSRGRLGVQLLDDGSAAVGWIEITKPRSQFRARTIAPDGTRSPAVTIADAEGSRYPRIARGPGELIFSWTENGKDGNTQVRTARAALARK